MKIYDNSYFSEVKGIINPIEQGWKFKKILPAYRKYIGLIKDSNINLIEIGSGAGLFLKHLVAYNHDKDIQMTSLEINKDSLKYLRSITPRVRVVIGDIAKKTPFKTNVFDLCVGIDVIEHIPDFRSALDEIARISQYAIFKIPIEKSAVIRTVNALSLGHYRKSAIDTVGHINWFSDKQLRDIFKKHFQGIEYFAYANIGLYQYRKYISKNKSLKKILLIIWYALSAILYKISPKINALIFGDHVVVLVKC